MAFRMGVWVRTPSKTPKTFLAEPQPVALLGAAVLGCRFLILSKFNYLCFPEENYEL
jgi:hypothetical protein